MKFSNNNAIFLQIADRICDDILSGVYKSDSRLPSVREYASMVEVNANTVMRSYETLARLGVIYNKRGIGFFVSPDAREIIVAERRRTFLGEEMPDIFNRLRYLDVTPEDLSRMYQDYLTNTSNPKK